MPRPRIILTDEGDSELPRQNHTAIAEDHSPTDAAALAQTAVGDQDAFRRLTDPHLREIHLHCYRMLGPIQDAEDALQETLLRAWRYLGSFEGRSSFRAWLYRIATNVCVCQRSRRPADPTMVLQVIEAIVPNRVPTLHLSPYPDALLDELETPLGNPSAEFDQYEGVQLAFLAVAQLLPARQRAVLLLHDVVGFSAAEVAGLLDSTVASVNRARSTLQQSRVQGRLQPHRQPGADSNARQSPTGAGRIPARSAGTDRNIRCTGNCRPLPCGR